MSSPIDYSGDQDVNITTTGAINLSGNISLSGNVSLSGNLNVDIVSGPLTLRDSQGQAMGTIQGFPKQVDDQGNAVPAGGYYVELRGVTGVLVERVDL